MTGCCAFGCYNRFKSGKKFYAIPQGKRDVERRKLWIQRIARANWKCTSSSKLCQDHFTPDQYEQRRADGKRKLKPNAVPSLFPHLSAGGRVVKKKKKPEKTRCAVHGCRSVMDAKNYFKRKQQQKGVTFHFFPCSNQERLKEWSVDTMKWIPDKTSLICSNHFTPDCFEWRRRSFYLRPDAVPTIFPNPGNPYVRRHRKELLPKRRREIEDSELDASTVCKEPSEDHNYSLVEPFQVVPLSIKKEVEVDGTVADPAVLKMEPQILEDFVEMTEIQNVVKQEPPSDPVYQVPFNVFQNVPIPLIFLNVPDPAVTSKLAARTSNFITSNSSNATSAGITASGMKELPLLDSGNQIKSLPNAEGKPVPAAVNDFPLKSPRQRKRKKTKCLSREIAEDDAFLNCDECQREYDGDCPIHGPLKIVDDTVVLKALCTLPPGLKIQESAIPEAGLGVIAQIEFSLRTRFGPFVGDIISQPGTVPHPHYSWQIFRDGHLSHYIDGQNPHSANWMRFVNCARTEEEQNLIAYQYHGQIYYRTCKPIPPGTELLVWYGKECALELGIHGNLQSQAKKKLNPEKEIFSCGFCPLTFSTVDTFSKHTERWHHEFITKDPVPIKPKPAFVRSPENSSAIYLLPLPVTDILNKETHTRHISQGVHLLEASSLENVEANIPANGAICLQEDPLSGDRSSDITSGLTDRQSMDIVGQEMYATCRRGDAMDVNDCESQNTGDAESGLNDGESQDITDNESDINVNDSDVTDNESRDGEFDVNDEILKNRNVYTTYYVPSKLLLEDEKNCNFVSFENQEIIQEKQLTSIEQSSKDCGVLGILHTTAKSEASPKTGQSDSSTFDCFQCQQCGKKYGKISALNRHVKKTHRLDRPFLCEICGKSFKDRYALWQHGMIHTGERPLKCIDCGKGFKFPHHLKNHLRIHSGERPYKCDQCFKGFAQSGNLQQHMRMHRGETSNFDNTNSGIHICEQCGRTCRHAFALNQHMKKHTGGEPYQCEKCGKHFTLLESLRINISVSHGQTYPCKECGNHFTPSYLLQLQKRAAAGHKCSECYKTYSTPSSLLTHWNHAHGTQEPFLCNVCGKQFRYPDSWKAHMRVHTGETIRCEDCGREFLRKSELIIHMRVHTGERPYKCHLCGRAFRQSYHVKTHLKVHKNQTGNKDK